MSFWKSLSRFQMMVWSMPVQHPRIALVHIYGDPSLAVDLPHGNTKLDMLVQPARPTGPQTPGPGPPTPGPWSPGPSISGPRPPDMNLQTHQTPRSWTPNKECIIVACVYVWCMQDVYLHLCTYPFLTDQPTNEQGNSRNSLSKIQNRKRKIQDANNGRWICQI